MTVADVGAKPVVVGVEVFCERELVVCHSIDLQTEARLHTGMQADEDASGAGTAGQCAECAAACVGEPDRACEWRILSEDVDTSAWPAFDVSRAQRDREVCEDGVSQQGRTEGKA